MRIERKLEKLLPQIWFHFWNKSNCWKWPLAEMRIERVTYLVFQLSNRDSWRFFCCWYGLVRHVRGQFILICCGCNAIFVQDRPLFPNFPLFWALETQLTFMAVGEPDYTNTCSTANCCLFLTWTSVAWHLPHFLGTLIVSRTCLIVTYWLREFKKNIALRWSCCSELENPCTMR